MYAEKPPYVEDEPREEKPPYTEPDTYKENPGESCTSLPDPNSPERRKAAKMGIVHKVCIVLTYVLFGVIIIGTILTKASGTSPFLIVGFLPLVAVILLGGFFKSRELKLRCTVRTTAHCVDTVRRRSGKHSRIHPIVEYEVNGVPCTAELSVSCGFNPIGDLYTIWYDPLDPTTVRVEKRGLFG